MESQREKERKKRENPIHGIVIAFSLGQIFLGLLFFIAYGILNGLYSGVYSDRFYASDKLHGILIPLKKFLYSGDAGWFRSRTATECRCGRNRELRELISTTTDPFTRWI